MLLLDWGVAVALDDRYGDRLPIAATERRVAGTPRYMAPEMATGQGDAQGPWTDVYLLGGVLHHVLSGRPPHRGTELRDVLLGIPGFRCDLPGAPTALASIVAKALAYAPAERFPDVTTFQREVRAFLGHRGAVRLAREASGRLDRLRGRLSEPAVPEEIYADFGPVRFGFEQALAEWPTYGDAIAGLRDAKEALARWELARGEPGAAAALIEADAPPELRAAITAAIAERQARDAALAAIRHDADPTVGRRTRAFVLAVLGGLWVIVPLVGGAFDVDPTWARMHLSTAVIFGGIVGLAVWARDSLSKTRVNRISVATLLLVAPLQLAGDLAYGLAGLGPGDAMALRAVGWAGLAAMYAVTVERTFALAAVGYIAAACVCLRWPALLPWVFGSANAVLFLAVFLAWGRDQLREELAPRPT